MKFEVPRKMFFPEIRSLYLAVFSANLLCFISGTALTWSSSEIPKLNNATETPWKRMLSAEESSWISSLVILGASVCPFLFGYLSDTIGRKPTLLYLGAPFFLGYVLLGFGQTVELFYVGRFLTGIGVGGVFTLLPMYLAEISEKDNRGAISSSIGCFCCLGLLFSVSLGPFISVQLFNLVLAMPPLIFLLSFFFLAPESPLFLVREEHGDLAAVALRKLGRKEDLITKEILELEASVKPEEDSSSLMDLFRSTAFIRALVMSMGLFFFQQVSGINAVMFYSQIIFEESGTTLNPEYCTIIVIFTQFLSSFLTPCIVDRYGRKLILLLSAMGMVVAEVPLGTYCYLKRRGASTELCAFVPVMSLAIFIVFFNMGFGPLPWTMLSELLPAKMKSVATAFVSTFVWILSFVVTKYFEQVVSVLGLGETFFVFSGFCLLAGLFSIFYLIETKGKSLQEIQEELSKS
uniref:Putative sugar transporter n=1 Tax=Phaedon cochleariae TaxID=80249 RepID=W4VS11_PHACE